MKLVITIIIGMFLTGCPVNNGQEGGFTSISKGSLFGAGEEGFEKENVIISSKAEWKSFLNKIDISNKVSETFDSSIDFSKEIVVGVIDRMRNTGGFSIEVTEVVEKKDNLLVKITTKGPKPTDMVTTVIIQPYHIIKINKTNKKILFIE